MNTTVSGVFYGLVCLAIHVNIFFCFCLLSPIDQNETPKQHVKVLLILKVTSNIFLQISILLYLFSNFFSQFFTLRFLSVFMSSYFASACMSFSLWLSIFYYTRIVPVQQAFFIWIKRNIKTIIYSGLTVQNFCILVQYVIHFSFKFSEMSTNFTGCQNLTNKMQMDTVNLVFQSLNIFYMLSYVVLTVFSWSSTLVYLCRHMKRTRTSSSSFSSAALRRQLRVTMMGIIQAGLSVFFLIFTVLYGYYLFQNDQNFFLIESSHLLLSISTTVNLGLGQSLFRKRAADLFYKVRQTVGKLRPVQR